MSDTLAASQNWNGNPMDSPLIKHVARLTCCRSVDNKTCYDAIARVAGDLSDFGELKEAIFYLEQAGWNAAEAFLQKQLDEEDRKRPFVDSNGILVDNTAANARLDRSIAKPGADFDRDLCGIDVVINGHVTTFTYPHASTIRPTSQADVNALNRWRHGVFRQHVGPAKTNTHSGTEFHPREQDYLLNRYAEQEIDPRGRANYEKITQDFNAVFVGVHLPGRVLACEARSRDSVTSLLTRKAVNPKEPNRKWPSHYNAVMRHAAAQERVQREWREKYRANELAVAAAAAAAGAAAAAAQESKTSNDEENSCGEGNDLGEEDEDEDSDGDGDGDGDGIVGEEQHENESEKEYQDDGDEDDDDDDDDDDEY